MSDASGDSTTASRGPRAEVRHRSVLPVGRSTVATELDAALAAARRALEAGDSEAALGALVDVFRAGDPGDAGSRIQSLCAALESDREMAHAVGQALRGLLRIRRVGPALTESGVTPATGFATELVSRLVRRILPELENQADLRVAVRRIFHRRDDHLRVDAVPDAVWARLIAALGITSDTIKGVDPELETAIRTIAHHVGSLGMQPGFTRRLPHLEDADSPFLALTDRVLAYTRSYSNEVEGDEAALLNQALETVRLCRMEVSHLRETIGQHGTSLELTGITFRLIQLLDRLELLLHLTDPDQRDFHASAVRLFREIVRAEKTRNHLSLHVRERADLLAYEVVEHAARKGSKYITTGRRDYAGFFVASMGGGLIVAVFSLVKTLIGRWDLALGVEGFLFGLNYSLCFILIYLTGSVLATKQPAMTANTIARALGDPDQRHLEDLETLVIRVWRSQFVSFVGNLIMALPVAFLISELFFRYVGETVANEEKAIGLLQALHPLQSGTIVYAAIAGFFLFLAGLISGWVDNRNLYSQLPERFARQPLLCRLLGARRTRAVADLVDRKLGILAGNVFLGFALGSMGTVGEILGLPLDIRHIAFAAAEFGTSLEILHFNVAWRLIWPVALGVALIGLVNFLVSFGLSLATALESRRITWNETRTLIRHLGEQLAQRPLDWFFPPKTIQAAPESDRRD